MTRLIIDLMDAADAEIREVGGKGLHLGLLHRLGLPVPDGFVLTSGGLTQGFSDALRQTLADEIQRRDWLLQPLAVRSSASHEDSEHASFAGIYESRLNIVGLTALNNAINDVLASLHTPQAIAYQKHQNIAEASMAIVIMPMLPAAAAGVAFSCDPQSGRDDLIVINAVKGLGNKLVNGEENGEEIVVAEDRLSEALAIIHRRPAMSAQSPVLTDAQAVELADLLRDTAQALDYTDPVFDFEWVLDDTGFWLVQARPVTARHWHTYTGLAGQEAIWSNGNTRDVVPHVMGAMDWIGWRRMVDLMLEQGYRLAGYPLLEGARRCALMNGRLYLNASLIQYEGYDALGIKPKAMNALIGGHHPEIEVAPPTWRNHLQRIFRLLRYLWRSPATRRKGKQQAVAAFAKTRTWRKEDLAALSDKSLIVRLLRLFHETRTSNELMFLQGSGGGNLYLLIELIGRYLPEDNHAIVAAIMAGGEPSVTAQQAYELQNLARLAATDPAILDFLKRGAPWQIESLPPDNTFSAALSKFIANYGHRGIYESYLSSSRYHEDPTYLLETIAGLLDTDPTVLEKQRQLSASSAWARIETALPPLKRWWAGKLVKIARQEINDRELARSALVAYGAAIRSVLLEIGKRLEARKLIRRQDDVFAMTPQELVYAFDGKLESSTLQARCTYRQAKQAIWEKLPISEVILGKRAQAPATTSITLDGAWQGIAVGHGLAEGKARIILSPQEGKRLVDGEILVAPSTDPAWTPLFLRAGGLVMETGGYLSHGAIVAREFGIPAVANLPGILETISDGQQIRVDGTRGQVHILN